MYHVSGTATNMDPTFLKNNNNKKSLYQFSGKSAITDSKSKYWAWKRVQRHSFSIATFASLSVMVDGTVTQWMKGSVLVDGAPSHLPLPDNVAL